MWLAIIACKLDTNYVYMVHFVLLAMYQHCQGEVDRPFKFLQIVIFFAIALISLIPLIYNPSHIAKGNVT